MSAIETDLAIVDTVQAELIECAPVPEPDGVRVIVPSEIVTPVERAAEATLEQTGAGPPPRLTDG
jgi:hypothetical protein